MRVNNSPPANSNPQTRRRWFRFSLRTFLVVFTLLCIALGLYVKRERDRYIAIETIKLWGGEVRFSDRRKNLSIQEQQARANLMFESVRRGKSVELPEHIPGNSQWQRTMLGKFGKYHGANVFGISVMHTRFTPDRVVLDLAILEHLTEIRELQLGASIDASELLRLPRLPQLEFLNFSNQILVTDERLEVLDRLPKLKSLQIRWGSLSDKGLQRIAACRLTELRLHDCDFPSDGLAHFADTDLSVLVLNACTVGDEAIPDLARLERLTYLYVANTNITNEGVAKLRAALPGCQVAF
jgi:hypothetical protein